MRYFLVDKILEIEKDLRLSAIKNVALSEDYFTEHFVGRPVMPGALQVEAMAQAGTVLLEASSGFSKKALLIMIDNAKFRIIVQPGDQLLIRMEIRSLGSDAAQMNGIVELNQKTVCDARLTFALSPVDEYYPPKARALIDVFYDAWLRDTKWIGF